VLFEIRRHKNVYAFIIKLLLRQICCDKFYIAINCNFLIFFPGVKPYKPATLDFSKKSNSSLIKKIDTILNRSSLLSKNKKETSEEDLTHYMRHIVEEGTKKKVQNK